MVVMVTASERDRVPQKCSMARRNPHTRTPGPFPSLLLLPCFIQRLEFT